MGKRVHACKIFKADGSLRVVADYCDKFGVKYERVCFELLPDVLDEADSTAADNVALMRRQGFHFLLTGFVLRALKCLRPLSSR